MKYKTMILAAAALMVAGCSQDLASKLKDGSTCVLKFSRFRDQGNEVRCSGTLIAGTDYSLKYDRTGGSWIGTGPVCGVGAQSHADPGAGPETGALSIWGASWKFDSKGYVFDKDGETIGTLNCP